MQHEPSTASGRAKRPLLKTIALPLVAFVAGIALMAWLLSRWSAAAVFLGVAPAPAEAVAPSPTPQTVLEQPEPEPSIAPPTEGTERLVLDPETTRRVNRLEERLAQLDHQSRAAVGNADRAEGLLVAFAARRAIDRGVALGYIETLLRERFAASEPQAVATVLTAARQPVTLQGLQKEFQELAPHLSGGGPDQSWWRALRTELGTLVTIRRVGTPSTQPAERLRRATGALESGQVEVALLEVLRLPNAARAERWVANARRYVSAHRSLDRLETAALLEPRASPPPPATRPAAR